MRKYMGHITAAIIAIAASAAFAQSDTPASTPAPVAPLPPPPQAAPAAPQTQVTPPAAPAAPQNPIPPAPPAAAPAPTPAAPEATAPAPAAQPQPETPPPAAETPVPETKTAAPAKEKSAAKKPAARKKPAKKKAVHESMGEWPDSPALAHRLQTENAGEPTSGAIPALPLDIMTNGNVNYVTGGIGDEELSELSSLGGSFDLHLLFSAVTGEYISDVGVRVLDDKQVEVLSVMNAGPYLYIQLPPGEYTIEATSEEKIKTAKVKVPAKGFARAHIAYTE